jgi:hypothetical protein
LKKGEERRGRLLFCLSVITTGRKLRIPAQTVARHPVISPSSLPSEMVRNEKIMK